ncbi:MAG: long-chain fatty acid--CoA ligase [Spirochaetaceae bacterium]|nr:MAG: long-chain fatty acid--CoA ligase [Spirochaetaceae bacterium]
MRARDTQPWKILDTYRGTHFSGEWPTLPELFAITCERYADRRAFTCFDPVTQVFSYRQAAQHVETIAVWLLERGLRKGDRVALTGKNSPEWAMTYLAILAAGGTVVPLDYQLTDEELARLMAFAEVKFLFVDREKHDSLPRQKSVKLKDTVSLSPEIGTYVLNLEAKADREKPGVGEDDLAAILFTSGTTGTPKGVMLTHKNLVSDCFLAQGHMNIYHTDVFYALLPIHHAYCMLAVFIESISVGAEIVFGKRLAVAQIMKDLKQGQVTMFLAIPMLFNKMIKGLMRGVREKGILVYGGIRVLMSVSGFCKRVFGFNPGARVFKGLLAKLALDTNRICICGGGPLPGSTFRMFNELGIDFVQGYGLTETSPILTLNPIEQYKEESVGQVIHGVEMKIVDPDERGNGDIVVRGPMVMQGYYRNDEATRETFTDDGWLITGDVGYLDSDRYLYLTGRKKSLIVTEGGKNVFPEEIEDHFQLYDEVEQVMVRGYQKDAVQKIEGIEAFIYPNPDAIKSIGEKRGTIMSADQVQSHIEGIVSDVNRSMLPYKRIEQVHVLDEPMEMTTTKKIKRHAVSV